MDTIKGGDSRSANQAATGMEEEPVNILRDKTFNKELRGLIDTIKGREKSFPDVPEEGMVSSGELEELTTDELIRKYHSLYYKTLLVNDAQRSYTAFNPLSLFRKKIALSNQALEAIIAQYIRKMGFEAFSFMDYSDSNGCYAFRGAAPQYLPADNFIIGLKTPILQLITENSHGAVVDKKDIVSDPFFSRIADWSTFGDDLCLYLALTHSIIAGIQSECGGEGFLHTFLPSPIIVLIFNKKDIQRDVDLIYKLLCEHIAIPLLLLDSSKKADDKTDHTIVGTIEHYTVLSFKTSEGGCACISVTPDEMQGYFLVRYLSEKLAYSLSSHAAIVHIHPRHLLVFFVEKDLSIIEKEVRLLNRYCNDIFSLTVLKNSDYNHPHELIKKILLLL